MSKINAEIKAFSIVETVITLIIATIIVSIVFILFSITEERLIDLKKSNSFSNDLNRLSFAINKDIFENDTLLNGPDYLTFIHYNKLDSINYIFSDSAVVRKKKDFTDTLFIKVKKISFEHLKSKNEKYHFLKMKFEIKDSSKSYELKFYKRFFLNSIVNQKNNN